MTALTDWTHALAAWAIPDGVLERSVDSPWVLPRQVFVRRAAARIAQPGGETHTAALAALSTSGTVLDVGAAAGDSWSRSWPSCIR